MFHCSFFFYILTCLSFKSYGFFKSSRSELSLPAVEPLEDSRIFKDLSVFMHLVPGSTVCSINRRGKSEVRVPIKPTDSKTDLES